MRKNCRWKYVQQINIQWYDFNIININRLLYEYGEILTRVSIAVTRACECHANANECQYFSIFVQ